jgi:asparagine synthase (glutamine-hydrolysing)
MCGFTGYFYFDDKKEASNKAIREMLALQKHRGPDDSGIVGIDTLNKSFEALTISEDKLFKTEKNLVFGFNRLSILDLSPMGHQPMISQDEQVIMMMNGEIYNAFDFKAELEEKGHVFKSTTDTELVLHLYLEYGMEKMIKMLNGMFALAIYDMNLNTLFLARDRFGIKPLYIINEAGRIAFASEMKSFKALPNFKFELDDSRLEHI